MLCCMSFKAPLHASAALSNGWCSCPAVINFCGRRSWEISIQLYRISSCFCRTRQPAHCSLPHCDCRQLVYSLFLLQPTVHRLCCWPGGREPQIAWNDPPENISIWGIVQDSGWACQVGGGQFLQWTEEAILQNRSSLKQGLFFLPKFVTFKS